MCITPEMFCNWCLMESFGEVLRYPAEEVKSGLRLCAKHKQAYVIIHAIGDTAAPEELWLRDGGCGKESVDEV